MALIKLVIALWILIMCIGAAGAVIIFIIDVLRWHDREEHVEVTPSNPEDIDIAGVKRFLKDINFSRKCKKHNSEYKDLDDIEESEVTMNGIENGIDAGQYNPPSLPGAWGES